MLGVRFRTVDMDVANCWSTVSELSALGMGGTSERSSGRVCPVVMSLETKKKVQTEQGLARSRGEMGLVVVVVVVGVSVICGGGRGWGWCELTKIYF